MKSLNWMSSGLALGMIALGLASSAQAAPAISYEVAAHCTLNGTQLKVNGQALSGKVDLAIFSNPYVANEIFATFETLVNDGTQSLSVGVIHVNELAQMDNGWEFDTKELSGVNSMILSYEGPQAYLTLNGAGGMIYNTGKNTPVTCQVNDEVAQLAYALLHNAAQ